MEKQKKLSKSVKLKKKSKETPTESQFEEDELTKILDNESDQGSDSELMNFDMDASTDDESADEENDNIHIPPAFLEVASDEEMEDESEEEEEFDLKGGKLTLKIIKEWQNELMQPDVSPKTIRNAMLSFNAALASISADETKPSMFKIENPAVFNAAIQLCIIYLYPAVSNYLEGNEKGNKNFHKGEKWRKLRNSLRHYFTNLAGLLERTTNTYMTILLLKHLHQMTSFISSFTVISKALLKALINLWSTAEDDSVRVLSFLCILKITRLHQKVMLNHVLKAMYMSYIRNCKFVSPNTLAGINFMRRSLIEIFLLDTKLAYQHAFLYIRQLAIHLRNAIILKKKQCFQAIHNWQYVNSVKFWAEMLSFSEEHTDLKPLVYPLVNLTLGLIKCTPTIQFYPLRFHCIRALIQLTRRTNIFIPILPFIFEILKGNLFKKPSTGQAIKAIDFTCILKVSKSQINDNSFKKEVIEQIFGTALEFLEYYSASLAYPDLIVPTVILLKKFIKNSKDANANRKLKQLLDKILENSKLIENERISVTFGLTEKSKINAWESNLRNKGTPLSIYYQNWSKVNTTKKKRQAANTSEINEYDIPLIKKRKVNATDEEEKINPEVDSDSDFFGKSESDEESDESNSEAKVNIVSKMEKKGKLKANALKNSKTKKQVKEGNIKKIQKIKKLKKKKQVDINEGVVNLNIDEW